MVADLHIFVFTWNTQTVRYNVDDGPNADFVNELGDKICNSERNYDLVVIGLQEDAIRDSPLLADEESLLVKCISEKYELLELVTMSGWGITTYKALKTEWDYRPRGLRLAVFKRKDLQVQILNVQMQETVCPGIRDWLTAGKGGVVVSITTDIGVFTFLNMHLPFSSRSIVRDDGLVGKRHAAVMWQAKCLKVLYEKAVEEFNPDYLFILGDLNFRVQIREEHGAADIAQRIFQDPSYVEELIREADELQVLLEYAKANESHSDDEGNKKVLLPILNEGVNNSGPRFYPTCKMRQGRQKIDICKAKSFRGGQEDQRTPSWCDRILFKQYPDARGELSCQLYDRWDTGSMNLSDHSAVIGVFHIAGHHI